MKPTFAKLQLTTYLSQLRLLVLLGVVVAAAALHFGLFDLIRITVWGDRLQDLLTLTLSVILGAFPFLVLGVTLSTLIAVFVDEKLLLRLLPRNRYLSHIAISLLGMLMPVCECGNIPLARRLMLKGFTASQAMTFLLGAPVINLVTIISTSEAFRYDTSIVVARIVGAFVIANMVGILMSFKQNQSQFLSANLMLEMRGRHLVSVSKWQLGMDTFQKEFFTVFRMLVVGAMVAASIQTFVPRDAVVAIGTNPILSILAMMLLGFVISICSSVDAFFALSLASTFTNGAIVAFLIFGPMIDIKILSMLKASFKGRVLVMISGLVGLASLLIGLIVNYWT